MSINREGFSRILNHLPGVIILTFGMLALYSSLILIQSREDLNVMYNNYSQDIILLQDNVAALDQAYIEFTKDITQHDISNFRGQFRTVANGFIAIQQYNYVLLEKNVEKQEQYRVFQYKIAQDIKRMSGALASYEHGTNLGAGSLSLHRDIISMNKTVGGLQRLVSVSFKDRVFSDDIEKKEKWLYWSVIAMGLSGFILIVLNSDKLTELKRMNLEKACAVDTLNNRLSALDMAQDGILIVDNVGKLSYMNKSLCLINGIDIKKRDQYVGGNWLSIFSNSDREAIKEDILPDLIDTGHWRGHFSLYRYDNSIVFTEISFTKLPDGGVIGTIQDISDQHKAEDEKKVLEEQFYQAQKMEAIGRLAGGIAHDFNNILAAMNGYTEFLIDDLDAMPEQQAFARNILQAGRQARSLVDQMLAFSRRGDSTVEPMDLVASVSDVLSMLHVTLSKSIELRSNFLVSDARIIGNATQISQLAMNLCVNAQDAMEDGYGCIDIEIKHLSAKEVGIPSALQDELPNPKNTPVYKIIDLDPGHSKLILGHLARGKPYVKLSIRDTGCGISRIVMERIFEPFFTTKAVDKGTGLGLSTVLGIVAIHQGFMIIDSVLGKGTCFELYFPLSDGREAENTPAEKIVASTDQKTKNQSKWILLVEDQEHVRGAIEEMLHRMGYNVSSVVSGLEGLDTIRENPHLYDLILTDYNMPKMTGLELAQQVYLDFPDVPFILLSGYSEERLADSIDGHPAIKAVLHKPVFRDALKDQIETVLEKRDHIAA
ncbi:MAG: hypothetical protein COA45_09580 [Zetaproteobacteria bacterium]|nr:MAG: hypothetical protein COA45_09580 [Zetaproteobacteria bacterium]